MRKQLWIVSYQTADGMMQMRRVRARSSFEAYEVCAEADRRSYPSHPEWHAAQLFVALPAAIVNNPEYTLG